MKLGEFLNVWEESQLTILCTVYLESSLTDPPEMALERFRRGFALLRKAKDTLAKEFEA